MTQPTDLAQILFPPRPRHFPGQRWLNMALRSAHLVGVAGIGGGFLFDLDATEWAAYWHLTLVTGVGLSLLYLWSTVAWLFELKGLAIVVKVALLAVGSALPGARDAAFVLVIVVSGLIAHAPARVRGARWLKWPDVADPHP